MKENRDMGIELREEVVRKITDIQAFVENTINTRVSREEFCEVMGSKIDFNTLKTQIDSRAGYGELESLRRMIENSMK